MQVLNFNALFIIVFWVRGSFRVKKNEEKKTPPKNSIFGVTTGLVNDYLVHFWIPGAPSGRVALGGIPVTRVSYVLWTCGGWLI